MQKTCGSRFRAGFALAASLTLGVPTLSALDPHKTLTQYTRTVWTQADGLPQDTIRRITQTSDGYLWLGTEEGLARFDGYDFTIFTKGNSSLPSNTVTYLSAGHDGTLWIGTAAGLARYRDGGFTVFTVRDGLPDNVISSVFEDHSGTLWVAAGIRLCRLDGKKFTAFPVEQLAPIQAVRLVYEDHQHTLWIAGVGGVVRFSSGGFVPVLGPQELNGNVAIVMSCDRKNNLWISGTKGLISRSPDGTVRKFDSHNGLSDDLVRALWIDRDGSVWAGTSGGLSRLEGNRFVSSGLGGRNDLEVRVLHEDREGDLWVGTNSGLNRLRDDKITMYGQTEGFPSDEPLAVHQDRSGDLWVGYDGPGLVAIQEGKVRIFTTRNGLPSNGINAIRESRNGDLLITTRAGLSRAHGGSFSNYVLPDPLGRRGVLDVLEDRHGQIWAAASGGVYKMVGSTFENLIRGGPVVNDSAVALSEGSDGSIWAGTFGDGLWQIKDGASRRYTTKDGLDSDQIRSLYQDPDGTLWIGTFGGGLNAFRNGKFSSYTAKDGLLSDNVSHIEDDGNGSLWLSTTRGICRIAKRQMLDFTAGRIKTLTPVNYGTQDGLRSDECAPGYPVAGGGTRTKDGRLWFPTSRGLAVIDPTKDTHEQAPPPPALRLLDITVDGQKVDLVQTAKLKPGTSRIQFRYTAIHLSAPERVRYAYKLDGLDHDWTNAGTRRVIDYTSLPHGGYRFLVRAMLPGQAAAEASFSEASFNLEVLPHFYERQYFLWLCLGSFLVAIYGLYELRLHQMRGRFSMVLEERARMAREIHDTLAQGFIGITRQLDAINKRIKGHDPVTQQHLELAQKMARHSLTEAMRSVMDLRAAELENGNLVWALTAAAQEWTAQSGVVCEIDAAETLPKLPEDVEHNVMRISQEAVTNALKHAGADKIWIRLWVGPGELLLTIKDNGRGFDLSRAFVTGGGHFGLLGMRERAERLGGELDLSSEPGAGTQVNVSIPLSERRTPDKTRPRLVETRP
jgi:signal transduction histidine kinase/ligand-binding sensor domain-containing protein